eukprot:sb/3467287/
MHNYDTFYTSELHYMNFSWTSTPTNARTLHILVSLDLSLLLPKGKLRFWNFSWTSTPTNARTLHILVSLDLFLLLPKGKLRFWHLPEIQFAANWLEWRATSDLHSVNINLDSFATWIRLQPESSLYDAPELRNRKSYKPDSHTQNGFKEVPFPAKRLEIATLDLHSTNINLHIPVSFRLMKSLLNNLKMPPVSGKKAEKKAGKKAGRIATSDLHSVNINLGIPVRLQPESSLYDAPELRNRKSYKPDSHTQNGFKEVPFPAKRLEIATLDLHSTNINLHIPVSFRPMKSLYGVPELRYEGPN